MTALSLLDLILVAASAGLGTYLTSYLKKKGESKALREDFNQVLAEVKKTTVATEEIKSDISQLSWQAQQSWEIKKEFYFEATRHLHEMKIALINASGFYDYPQSEHDEDNIRSDPNFQGLFESYLQNKQKLVSLLGPSEMMFPEPAFKILDDLVTNIWHANEGAVWQKQFIKQALELTEKAQKAFLSEAKKVLFSNPANPEKTTGNNVNKD